MTTRAQRTKWMREWLDRDGNRARVNAKRRAAYALDSSAWQAKQKRHHKNNPASYLCSVAKARAKRKGIRFNISPRDLAVPERCPVLGIRLWVRFGKKHDNSPSIDRIDNRRGYVRSNVAVISHKANQIKSNGSLAEHEALVRWLRKQRKKGASC